MEAASDSSSNLTVYYNGACPICRREIDHYRRLAVKGEEPAPLAWIDISRHHRALAAFDINQLQATRRLYAVDSEGQLYGGVSAFEQLWRRLPAYCWLGRLVGVPVISKIAALIYEGILAPGLYRYNRWREDCRRCGEEG